LRELKIVSDLGRRIEDILEEVQPEILHAHSPVLNALPTIRAGRRHGVPVVYEVRSIWEDAATVNGTSSAAGLRYRASQFLETHALRRADAVTTICQGLRDDVVARGIPGEKVTIIPNAVDRDVFTGPGKPDRSLAGQLGLFGKTVLAFFGSLFLPGIAPAASCRSPVAAERPGNCGSSGQRRSGRSRSPDLGRRSRYRGKRRLCEEGRARGDQIPLRFGGPLGIPGSRCA
jgi:glycosyltransferase involved in cell wall biosynthesis